MTKPILERVTITIPQPLLAAADEMALRLDRSRSWILAEAVRRMMATEGSVAPTQSPQLEGSRTPPPGKAPRNTGLRTRLSQSLALTPAARFKSAEERGRTLRLGELCRALSLTESRYLVTGTAGEILQGHFQPARRVEFFMKRSLDNAVRVLAALETVGYPEVQEWLPEQLLDQSETAVRGDPAIVLVNAIPGLRFDDAEQHAEQQVMSGTRIPVMTLADLALVRTAGPLADPDALAELQLLQELTREAAR